MYACRVALACGGLALAGCTEGAQDHSVNSGRVAMAELGCGTCHVIPGIDWPRASVGPSLDAFADRNLIAGTLPNTPANLAAFVRNATLYAPAGAMPPIAMTDQQARDIAAYLLSLTADATS